jgi:hypothetical protein
MKGEELATGNKLPDRVAASLRALVSSIPFAGGALCEIINEIIPNQRIDRIERFLTFLSEEMEALRATNQYPTAEGPQLELFEMGLRAAASTSAAEKQSYLAKCVAKGLTKADSQAIRAQRIARIISELDAEEMIVLLSYTKFSIGESQEFCEQYPEIFDVPALLFGSNQDARKRNAEYEAAKRHLIALGLLSEEIQFDRETGTARRFGFEVDKDTDITLVGRLVLFYAGLIAEM